MNYKFTQDFDLRNHTKNNILHIFRTYGIPENIIEIGSYEGKTTVWLSDEFTPYNKKLKIITIDPFTGSDDLPYVNFDHIKENFLYNIKSNKYTNVQHIENSSRLALLELINNQFSAEFIFIDGDHNSDCVLIDLIFSWQILKLGGVMLCDDATDWKFKNKEKVNILQKTPRLAIDSFLHCFWDKLEVLDIPCQSQIAIRKIKD